VVQDDSDSENTPPSQRASEDSDSMPVPDQDDSGVVQVVSGNGFQIANEVSPIEEPMWTVTVVHGHMRAMSTLPEKLSECMSEVDGQMLKIESH
jgi:hypothetical protein